MAKTVDHLIKYVLERRMNLLLKGYRPLNHDVVEFSCDSGEEA